MPITFVFKKCQGCGFEWMKREDFLKDGAVKLAGYEVNLEALGLGDFLFSHKCGATLALHVDGFTDLYKGPIYMERKTGSPECLGYCKKRDELKPCPVRCECAWVRELIQMINGMKR